MKKNPRVPAPVLLISLVMLAGLTYAASRTLRSSQAAQEDRAASVSAILQNEKRSSYLRRSSLSPKLVWNLNALGDRLEKPGRERLRITGTLARTNDSQTETVDAVLEFPDRLRLTIQKGTGIKVVTFDGDRAKAAGISLETAEQDLIETLVYGTAEHFFNTQSQGLATRLLGSRFRLDDGSAADYKGPYYDVYKVADRVTTSTGQREQIKLYYFNSETLLLERVSYEVVRNGSAVKVEERLDGWTREQGQQVARRIERFENGASVFVLKVRAAGLGPRVNDGTFAN